MIEPLTIIHQGLTGTHDVQEKMTNEIKQAMKVSKVAMLLSASEGL